MKLLQIQAALICLLMSNALLAATPENEQAFIEKYTVDPEVQALLDAHSDDLKAKLEEADYDGTGTHFVWTFPWLPNYFVKASLERIYGMERMRRCIETYNLDLLTLPDKRIYHIKGRPTKLSNKNYVVVVKKVPTEAHGPLNLRQVQQLCTIIKKASYISMTGTNYIRQKDDKICLIDTESTFDDEMILKGYTRQLSSFHNINKDYTPDALAYIFDQIFYEIENKKKSQHGYDWRLILPYLKKEMKKGRASWDYVSYWIKNCPR